MQMEALKIIAGSWPIAVMVVGLAIVIAVRRSFKQTVDDARDERLDRARGNQAVMVAPRGESRMSHSDEG